MLGAVTINKDNTKYNSTLDNYPIYTHHNGMQNVLLINLFH